MPELSDYSFVALTPEVDLSTFNCGDEDINAFLHNDASNYQDQKMGNTYLFLSENREIVSYFTISNDCLNDLGEQKGFTNNIWNKLHRKISLPNPKRIRQYPAVKIGRIGISLNFQKLGLGNQILDFIKGWITIDHKPACRLLLLDAYNKEKQLAFYQKNDFIFLLNEDVDETTRLMYFDLTKLQ
ncbi:GNAT family N-acetyltransferase [Chitinophaga qingshengii]|uniref:GNAT family N-acetyltransferase n=1 Tax=Chitinophaga qingshengii TaxID=1569794 RepID=A0ABR7TSY8_9BACT|nr:GNAT family N-acetyltransferase [Chitinophaga qingshengii]MBC9932079.1 GNAT family N-acetyltransferase [Chitinophaga qingshengii]